MCVIYQSLLINSYFFVQRLCIFLVIVLWKLFILFYIAFNSVHNCVALLSGLGQVIST